MSEAMRTLSGCPGCLVDWAKAYKPVLVWVSMRPNGSTYSLAKANGTLLVPLDGPWRAGIPRLLP